MYDRIVALSEQHRTMLIFSNTRRLAERVAHDLGERMGHERVAVGVQCLRARMLGAGA